jgi:hypothetical protein
VAQYPRIVIGSELLNYLKESVQAPGQSRESALGRVFAEKCLELIYIDTDGAPTLDYAGKSVRELHPDWKEVIHEAVKYVRMEWERFKKEGNHKLASRYYSLLSYLSGRQRMYWV